MVYATSDVILMQSSCYGYKYVTVKRQQSCSAKCAKWPDAVKLQNFNNLSLVQVRTVCRLTDSWQPCMDTALTMCLCLFWTVHLASDFDRKWGSRGDCGLCTWKSEGSIDLWRMVCGPWLWQHLPHENNYSYCTLQEQNDRNAQREVAVSHYGRQSL